MQHKHNHKHSRNHTCTVKVKLICDCLYHFCVWYDFMFFFFLSPIVDHHLLHQLEAMKLKDSQLSSAQVAAGMYQYNEN
jgi:hypothetical protein